MKKLFIISYQNCKGAIYCFLLQALEVTFDKFNDD